MGLSATGSGQMWYVKGAKQLATELCTTYCPAIDITSDDFGCFAYPIAHESNSRDIAAFFFKLNPDTEITCSVTKRFWSFV